MKKTIAIILAAIMLLASATVAVANAAGAGITLNGEYFDLSVGSTFTYVVKVKTPVMVENGQFDLHYPGDVLKVEEVVFPNIASVHYNHEENVSDEVLFNFSRASGYEIFLEENELVNIKFKVVGEGSGDLVLDKLVMCNMDDENIISTINFKESIEGADVPTTPIVVPTSPSTDPAKDDPTEAPTDTPVVNPTDPTNPTVDPSEDIVTPGGETEQSEPVISAKTANIKAGATFKLSVTGNKGTVKFSSSKKKIAKVTSKGKVTALNRGRATITAEVDGQKLTCSVVVSSKPKLSRSSVTVKKGKTVKVKLTGKAASIKNKYTNTKIAKITSAKTAKTLKIKGLKKGTTTLKIKVNGVVTLKLKVKVKK